MRSWRILLLEHVTNYVMDSVVDLETFLQEAEEGLVWRTGENENGDAHNGREALLRMMGHLAEVRSRQSGTDALFTPLQEVNSNVTHFKRSPLMFNSLGGYVIKRIRK